MSRTLARLGRWLLLLGLALFLALHLLMASWPTARISGFEPGSINLHTPMTTLDLASLTLILAVFGLAISALACVDGRPALPSRALWIPLTLLVVLCAASSLNALDPSLSLQRARLLLTTLVLAGLIAVAQPASGLARRAVVLTLVIQSACGIAQFTLQRSLGLTALAESVITNVQSAGVSVVLDRDEARWLRAYGLTEHPNILGGILASGLLLVLAVMGGESASRRSAALKLLVLVLGSTALALTFSRSAWLGLGIGLTSLALMVHRQSASQFKRLAAASAILLLSLGLTLAAHSSLVLTRLDPSSSPLEGRSMAERTIDWSVAPALIAAHPLLGVGGGNYTLAARAALGDALAGWPGEPAHNMLLLISAEIGVAGGLAWAALMLTPIVQELVSKNDNRSGPGLAAGLLALFVVGQFDHYLWDQPQALVWTAVLLGLWAARPRQQVKSGP